MEIIKSLTAKELGEKAGSLAADKINEAIAKKGRARIILSTGASQFETLEALVSADVDWSKVEMFHLDEYVNISEEHPASFRKYLKERFINKVNPKIAYLVDGNNPEESIAYLTEKICEAPIDVALIGIGENGHIAFNDPPADFDTKESYIVVTLDEKCRKQQVGEGWFNGIEDVPKQAISMTPYRIMQSEVIISAVPHKVKENAIKMTLEAKETTPMIPATLLKEHKEMYLFLDENSAGNTAL
ncbi:MAG: glucosamine-6-phosphate deaminase [Clostridia bacterium]|nr:glucosamine-6-phosphate deaminase [Clostridia bacterium]